MLFLWLRPKPEPAWISRCDALSDATSTALAGNDLELAGSNLAQAQAICQDARREALAPLASQLGHARKLAETCDAVARHAEDTLARNRPKQAKSQLAAKNSTCAGYPIYDSLVERTARRIQQAITLIDNGSRQLRSGDTAGAESSLMQALGADNQVAGADDLRMAIANARREPDTTVIAQPSSAQPSIATTDALVENLLQGANDALEHKNYAEAKASARNALRISPGNRAAAELLRKAESAERQALQDIVID